MRVFWLAHPFFVTFWWGFPSSPMQLLVPPPQESESRSPIVSAISIYIDTFFSFFWQSILLWPSWSQQQQETKQKARKDNRKSTQTDSLPGYFFFTNLNESMQCNCGIFNRNNFNFAWNRTSSSWYNCQVLSRKRNKFYEFYYSITPSKGDLFISFII